MIDPFCALKPPILMDHADYMCSHQVVAGTVYNFDVKWKIKPDCARKMNIEVPAGLIGMTVHCHLEVSEGLQQRRKINREKSSCQDPRTGDSVRLPRNDQHPDYYRDAGAQHNSIDPWRSINIRFIDKLVQSRSDRIVM